LPVVDGPHGRFRTAEVPRRVQQFFDKELRGQEVTISTEPIKMEPAPPQN